MLDKVTIMVKAGDGGAGAVSFRREKFVPRGGPDGGDGGDGGSVVIEADETLSNLNYFYNRRDFKAGDGKPGYSQRRHGKTADDLRLKVPLGTMVRYRNISGDNFSITDLSRGGDMVKVADGGRGGLGNTHFVSSTNQVPRLAQKGEAGGQVEVELELKLIADAGIIGLPNAGKSSLLAACSAASPKIADYAFTTLEPAMGVVNCAARSFVVAEIPGLIRDAHLGKGLGHDFLRHLARTRVLVHLIDGGTAQPLEDMILVNNELFLFDPLLAEKPQMVVINKIDQPPVRDKIVDFKHSFAEAGYPVFFISALTGEGVTELMNALGERTVEKPAAPAGEEARPVIRPIKKESAAAVRLEHGVFVISSPFLERIVAGSDVSNPEVQRQVTAILAKPETAQRLAKAGVGPGARVRIGDYEWVW